MGVVTKERGQQEMGVPSRGRGQLEWEWPMWGGVSMNGGVATRGRGHRIGGVVP